MLERSYTNLRETVAAQRAGNDRSTLARALRKLGQSERDHGKLVDALAAYEEAVALHRQMGDAREVAHALRHAGDVRRKMDDGVGARAAYVEALALYRGDPDVPPLELANALRPLAILDESDGRTTEAVAHWEEAARLYAVAGIEAGTAECSGRLTALRA